MASLAFLLGVNHLQQIANASTSQNIFISPRKFSLAKSIVVAGESANHGLLVIKYHLINQK